jgi:zinc/manganese transport system substrate-binding protein
MFSRRSLLRSAAAVTALSLPFSSSAWADEPLPVVASFSILGDLVAQVGGEHIALTTLVGADGDAHVYQPTPQDARAVARAEVLFVNGLEFEGWMERLVESSGFGGMQVVATDGIEAIAFDEHDEHGDEHDDHEDHDDHADHDDHGDEHGHGAHAFEWAGLFDLKAGTYQWSFAKVDGDYADPAMKMVVLAASDIEAVDEAAEGLLEAEASDAKMGGDTLAAADMAYTLTFDANKDITLFTVEIAEDGTYAFFTEHMPFEFEADAHFFKDMSGADVEPVAQDPEGDHHAHGYDDHDDHAEEGHDDHHGHNHGAFDPHAWQSVDNAVIYVNNIAAALAKAAPENAEAFEANRAAYVAELEALETEIEASIGALPAEQRTVVTPHDAFGYFAQSYNIRFEAPQGLSTESEASAADVAKLIEQIRKEGINAVFVESITDDRLLKQIANETGAVIGGTLYSDALSDEDGPASTYLDMMRHNVATLSQALGS